MYLSLNMWITTDQPLLSRTTTRGWRRRLTMNRKETNWLSVVLTITLPLLRKSFWIYIHFIFRAHFTTSPSYYDYAIAAACPIESTLICWQYITTCSTILIIIAIIRWIPLLLIHQIKFDERSIFIKMPIVRLANYNKKLNWIVCDLAVGHGR